MKVLELDSSDVLMKWVEAPRETYSVDELMQIRAAWRRGKWQAVGYGSIEIMWENSDRGFHARPCPGSLLESHGTIMRNEFDEHALHTVLVEAYPERSAKSLFDLLRAARPLPYVILNVWPDLAEAAAIRDVMCACARLIELKVNSKPQHWWVPVQRAGGVSR